MSYSGGAAGPCDPTGVRGAHCREVSQSGRMCTPSSAIGGLQCRARFFSSNISPLLPTPLSPHSMIKIEKNFCTNSKFSFKKSIFSTGRSSARSSRTCPTAAAPPGRATRPESAERSAGSIGSPPKNPCRSSGFERVSSVITFVFNSYLEGLRKYPCRLRAAATPMHYVGNMPPTVPDTWDTTQNARRHHIPQTKTPKTPGTLHHASLHRHPPPSACNACPRPSARRRSRPSLRRACPRTARPRAWPSRAAGASGTWRSWAVRAGPPRCVCSARAGSTLVASGVGFVLSSVLECCY